MNEYQIDTLIQLNVTFYNVALNVPADPQNVALFIEDPFGNVTSVGPTTITRTGVGTYFYDFLPSGPGVWTYKWQGSGTTSVVATSRDTRFLVKGSELVS
jgi:hypothetical protein